MSLPLWAANITFKLHDITASPIDIVKQIKRLVAGHTASETLAIARQLKTGLIWDPVILEIDPRYDAEALKMFVLSVTPVQTEPSSYDVTVGEQQALLERALAGNADAAFAICHLLQEGRYVLNQPTAGC